MIFPKKPQILYAPMLATFGGGSANGFRASGGGGPIEIVSGDAYVQDTGSSVIFSLPANVGASATRSQLTAAAQTVNSFSSFYIREPERLTSIRMGGGRGGKHLSSQEYGGRGTGLKLTFSTSDVTSLQNKTNTLCYVGYGMGGFDGYGGYNNSSIGGACSYIGFATGSHPSNHDLIAVAAGAGGGPKYTGTWSFGGTSSGQADADWDLILSSGQAGNSNDNGYRTGGGQSGGPGSSNTGYQHSNYQGYETGTKGGWLFGGGTYYDGGGGGAGAYGGGGGFDFSGSNGGAGGGGVSLRNDNYCDLAAYYMAGSETNSLNVAQNLTAINAGWRCEIFYS